MQYFETDGTICIVLKSILRYRYCNLFLFFTFYFLTRDYGYTFEKEGLLFLQLLLISTF